ncbi:MAG: cyclic nucleotide-binding/CBS domain-containing protein [Candidatus Bathyarchaeia archaeon]
MSEVLEDILKSVMSTKVETVKPKQPLKLALNKMIRRNIGSIIVVDGGEPVGIVTERDISRKMAKGLKNLNTQVMRVMARKLIVASPDTTIQAAFGLMLEHGIRRIPVVDDGKLVGVVTERDLLHWVLQVSYEPNIPPEIIKILARPLSSRS